ncbi:MAG: hypothetical protein COB67_08970 [SAR324 cluster bacterium]|uniref:Class I SAM-dependent methyltransferase n=1 Tax=SAR324 cluster bacterium TaxID=2024889 RepID=A0A2A4T1P1_9DELT|nr:MAG: hypothetical protein COB67_08970 [SAR324 cluster bacterium]
MTLNNTEKICKLCREREFEVSFTVGDAVFSSNIKKYDVIRCKKCGLSTMTPFPTQSDLNEIYVRDNTFSKPFDNPYKNSLFYAQLEPLFLKVTSTRKFTAEKSLQLIKRGKSGSQQSLSILDIGCSTGILLKEFHAIDPQIELHGIDVDPDAKRKAPEYMKDNIYIEDFLKKDFGGHKFDIITMSFVIEHVVDFDKYLDKIHELLVDGGIFFFSTPDIGSAKAIQQKADWKMVNDKRKAIGHIYWFDDKSINHLIKRYDYNLLDKVNIGETYFYLPKLIQKALKAVVGTDFSGERIIRWYTPRILYSIAFDFFLSKTLSYGDLTYVFLGKKQK